MGQFWVDVNKYAFLELPQRAAPIKLHWWWFVDAFGRGRDQAHPFLVPGAGVASHETRFAPALEPCPGSVACPQTVAYRNYMAWLDFLALAKSEETLPNVKISFVAKIKERNYREITKSCKVAFNDRARQDFATELTKLTEAVESGRAIEDVKNKKEYFSFPCITEE